MAEENIPAPTRSDDQLVPVKARLPYGKSNLLLDLQKLQKNPILRISVDILQNTNFFRAFTTSANVPSIYIQLFWNTLTHEAKSGVYIFLLDEQYRHNIHRRPESLVHVTSDDFLLSNLKLVPNGEKDEVFGKPIPKELITESI
ncbi:hypothetical protein Tco_1226943 [Tanacetum coccineum]